ncbi:isochorismate synthase, partial [Shewanella sp. 0m-11]
MTIPLLPQAIKSLTDKIKSFTLQPNSDPIVQLSVVVSPIPVIAWLAAQTTYPRVYWKGRDTQE